MPPSGPFPSCLSQRVGPFHILLHLCIPPFLLLFAAFMPGGFLLPSGPCPTEKGLDAQPRNGARQPILAKAGLGIEPFPAHVYACVHVCACMHARVCVRVRVCVCNKNHPFQHQLYLLIEPKNTNLCPQVPMRNIAYAQYMFAQYIREI